MSQYNNPIEPIESTTTSHPSASVNSAVQRTTLFSNGGDRVRDRNRGPAEIKSVDQNACDDAMGNSDAVRPFRSRYCGDDCHEPHDQRHADREIGQRIGIVHDVFGGDKAGTPEHDKNRWRRARGQSVKFMIHLLLSLPDRMLCGNVNSRGSAGAV